MSRSVIELENVSKYYRLGTIGGKTINEDIQLLWSKMRGKENPLLKVGETDYGNREGEFIWALRDINLKVEQGDILGIIGANGAGKSTLLKILSRITGPTSGKVKVKGRIGSLLEVGTGFHPELTGRENVYLNGAILGMRRHEIDKKFDEIVDFSGVEKYIDTPVKRYSSGMRVRLGFAVAAYLDPEILVVDEVLAVGDAEFQKKCLGKMSDVAGEGRTVLFVSHNMGSIRSLCKSCALIDKGKLSDQGITVDIVDKYLSVISKQEINKIKFVGPLIDQIQFTDIKINNYNETRQFHVSPSEDINIEIYGKVNKEISDFKINFSLFKESQRIFTIHDVNVPKPLFPGKFVSKFSIPKYFLRPNKYSIAIGGGRDRFNWIWGEEIGQLIVKEEWGQRNDQKSVGIINMADSCSRGREFIE